VTGLAPSARSVRTVSSCPSRISSAVDSLYISAAKTGRYHGEDAVQELGTSEPGAAGPGLGDEALVKFKILVETGIRGLWAAYRPDPVHHLYYGALKRKPGCKGDTGR
jgi:hypothetical protein